MLNMSKCATLSPPNAWINVARLAVLDRIRRKGQKYHVAKSAVATGIHQYASTRGSSLRRVEGLSTTMVATTPAASANSIPTTPTAPIRTAGPQSRSGENPSTSAPFIAMRDENLLLLGTRTQASTPAK